MQHQSTTLTSAYSPAIFYSLLSKPVVAGWPYHHRTVQYQLPPMRWLPFFHSRLLMMRKLTTTCSQYRPAVRLFISYHWLACCCMHQTHYSLGHLRHAAVSFLTSPLQGLPGCCIGTLHWWTNRIVRMIVRRASFVSGHLPIGAMNASQIVSARGTIL